MLSETSTYEEVKKRLLEGQGVVEITERLRNLDLTCDYVYTIYRQLHARGLVRNSPYSMVQERVRGTSHYPWKVIVLSALMNRTHARQVRPIVKALFLAWPTPTDLASASEALEVTIGPLGFAKTRAKGIRTMSADYARGVKPENCHGVGPFGRDALAVFVHGRTDVEPSDGFLARYVEWKRTGKADF